MKAAMTLKVNTKKVELQRALDANVYLFDEREQVLKLQAEDCPPLTQKYPLYSATLKIQELEDRRRPAPPRADSARVSGGHILP